SNPQPRPHCHAGATGLSATFALSMHPDRFPIIVFNEELVASGMVMKSIAIDSA
ncbi:hypothetical protein H4582DRAFT_1824722, partial [Lactarius indigo]